MDIVKGTTEIDKKIGDYKLVKIFYIDTTKNSVLCVRTE